MALPDGDWLCDAVGVTVRVAGCVGLCELLGVSAALADGVCVSEGMCEVDADPDAVGLSVRVTLWLGVGLCELLGVIAAEADCVCVNDCV